MFSDEFVDLFRKLHSVDFKNFQEIDTGFRLRVIDESFTELDEQESFDIVYHDAFAPSVQSEFWENPFLNKIYSALRPGGCLTSYCAKGSFRRALIDCGFEVQRLPGPPGKREMIRAVK